MRKILTILVCILFGIGLLQEKAYADDRTVVSGRVNLSGTRILPGDFVMIYAPSLGTGSLSDETGQFSLEFKGDTGQKVMLEFSRIGYGIKHIDVELNGGTIDLGEILLEQQTLMLMAAYITTEGRDPGEVILEKVWEQCKRNSKKRINYNAEVSYSISTSEIPVVAKALPTLAKGGLKLFAAHEGYGPLLKYCLKNEEFSAKASFCRKVTDGKTLNYNKRLLSSNTTLPQEVKRNVLDILDPIDFFDILYEDTRIWGKRFTKNRKFTLTGSYEYGDKIIDVISHTDRHDRATINLHIVEDSWMFLKIQICTKEGEVLRIEARDPGNGLHMPVSMVMKPSITMIRAEQIPSLIEEVKKSKDLNKKTKEKMVSLLEGHLGEDFNPYIIVGGNVKYQIQ